MCKEKIKEDVASRKIILCSGPQSSGTTIISWCFLQRPDVDGYLDFLYDQLPLSFTLVKKPITWLKQTDACFRITEIKAFLEWEGFQVFPLFIIRDVRSIFSSLMNKWYGINGNTAEDPPLRLRLLRFKDDWLVAKANKWPIIIWEAFLKDPVNELHNACEELNLSYDNSMEKWPKRLTDIAYPGGGNQTFHKSLGADLLSTIIKQHSNNTLSNIPNDDLQWMEREFSDYNKIYGYPEHVEVAATNRSVQERLKASFEKSRRYRTSPLKFNIMKLIETYPLIRKIWFAWNAKRILTK